MEHGCMRAAFRWDAVGAASALRRDMKARFLQPKNCGISAILAMPRAVGVCRQNESGTLCGLELERSSMTATAHQLEAFKFATSVNVDIVR